jgi:hypothetical protein
MLVKNFVAAMKGKQQQPARLQYSQHLAKDRGQRFSGNVDDGIERRDPGKRSIRKIQRQHVALPERNVRVQSPCLLQRSRRKIQSENRRARIPQVARHLTRPAPHVTNLATSSDFSGKAIEQSPVQRLVPKFAVDLACILVCHPIVAFTNRSRDAVAHRTIIISPAPADVVIEMPVTLALHDETMAGESRSAGTFQFDSANPTLRQIIQLRVQQEVARFNQAECEMFQGLVQPEESERILNGVKTRPVLDWQKQLTNAIAAFKGNGFLVLLDDHQIMDLDEPLEITPWSKITFLRLVPLIEG